jgi:hypothetical protein
VTGVKVTGNMRKHKRVSSMPKTLIGPFKRFLFESVFTAVLACLIHRAYKAYEGSLIPESQPGGFTEDLILMSLILIAALASHAVVKRF